MQAERRRLVLRRELAMTDLGMYRTVALTQRHISHSADARQK